VKVDSPSLYRDGGELDKLSRGYKWTPLFVFLDENSKMVFRTNGFSNPHEAKVIHEFVSKQLYKTTSFREFSATRPMQ
jgi:hypothetical protein